MDKIYSRKRFLIPKIRKRGGGGRLLSGLSNEIKNHDNSFVDTKLIKTVIIVIIAVSIANRIIATIEPTMDVICIDMAKSIATKISNEQATVVMGKYKYEDISKVVRDEQGNIKMVQMDIVTVNAITSDVALRIQEGLDNYKSDEFTIKLGTFTRN